MEKSETKRLTLRVLLAMLFVDFPFCQAERKGDRLVAIDCEMCYSADGPELTRCSVVDDLGLVIYDKLVKPAKPIVDYVTQFSGITAEMLQDVTTTLSQVQVRSHVSTRLAACIRYSLPPLSLFPLSLSLFRDLNFSHRKRPRVCREERPSDGKRNTAAE